MNLNKIYIYTGLTIFISLIYSILFFEANPRMFFHFPSLIYVVFAGASLGLACFRGGGFLKYIKACKKHFLSAGILVTVIRITVFAQNLSNPESFGFGTAVALLAVYYGIILYCIADAITTQ